MSLLSTMSLLFGGISGYRTKINNPIDTPNIISYFCVTSPFFAIKMFNVKKPHMALPAIIMAPIVNGGFFYSGHIIGRECLF